MLIAVCGFSGVGKTTALEHLRDCGFGRIYYAGGLVRQEAVARGLELTPEVEKLVRNELRESHGADVFAQRAVKTLLDEPRTQHVLLDAICHPNEAVCYRRAWGAKVVILGLSASFEVRAARLAKRTERPCTATELRLRDEYERRILRLNDVMRDVDHAIANEANIDAFRRELDALMSRWRASEG